MFGNRDPSDWSPWEKDGCIEPIDVRASSSYGFDWVIAGG